MQKWKERALRLKSWRRLDDQKSTIEIHIGPSKICEFATSNPCAYCERYGVLHPAFSHRLDDSLCLDLINEQRCDLFNSALFYASERALFDVTPSLSGVEGRPNCSKINVERLGPDCLESLALKKVNVFRFRGIKTNITYEIIEVR